ncbi:hypothetical protein B1F79_00160 [Coxiella-like endosymbiont of Rhipicephalus sanguineus]|uniref:hypothetical protein n=1 Tax=Coxiella-like endosymbiont of Rhipicephalus sanguineus TaxID=1955402 RepID=UPI00203ED783|nr:hypothetical protein [Coxiella-like endosymbiont of Rhipicephalus sanguineus]MBT8506216.1 hypothetical protein [Coxiella-like endosymbiont of Rhipicephalus sanguineus]
MCATCYGKTTTDTQFNLLASSFFQLRNEPPKNVVNFHKNFQVVGLAITKFYPCYGFSESILYATGSVVNWISVIYRSFLSVGRYFEDCELIIVDSKSTHFLIAGEVGEI